MVQAHPLGLLPSPGWHGESAPWLGSLILLPPLVVGGTSLAFVWELTYLFLRIGYLPLSNMFLCLGPCL